MGTVCAPPYATIFMKQIDELIKELAKTVTNADPIRLYKRFLDDIFLVWSCSVPELQTFLEEINNIHPSIKFTSEFTCPYKCNIVSPHDCFCHHFLTLVCPSMMESSSQICTESLLIVARTFSHPLAILHMSHRIFHTICVTDCCEFAAQRKHWK